MTHQANISLNLNYLGDAATALKRGEPLFFGVEHLQSLLQDRTREPEPNDNSLFDLALELEGKIQDFDNLAQVLDVVAEEITVSHIDEPLPMRLRNSLTAVNDALRKQVREAEVFVETSYSTLRRGIPEKDLRTDVPETPIGPRATVTKSDSLPTNASERSPYDRACHVHELIQSVETIVNDLPAGLISGAGLSALLTVLEEKSRALTIDLDARAFCECWPAVSAALDKDASLGFAG